MADLRVRGAKPIACSVTVPGDVRQSSLAVMLAALANGTSRIVGFPPTACGLRFLEAVRALGVRIDVRQEPEPAEQGTAAGVSLLVHGPKDGLRAPDHPIDCGECLTTAAVMTAVLAAQPFRSEVTVGRVMGDPAIRRVIEALGRMGARIERKGGTERWWLDIEGGPLTAQTHRLVTSCAEERSALLLASALGVGKSVLMESGFPGDQAERVFRAFGVAMRRETDRLVVHGGQRPEPQSFLVAGDISLALCWLVAAAAQPGGELQVASVSLNPSRTGVLKVLARMGASIQEIVETKGPGEPTGRLILRGSRLSATTVAGPESSSVLSELPFLAVAAALAEGTTVFRDIADAEAPDGGIIEPLVELLGRFGVVARTAPGSIEIDGPAHLRSPRHAVNAEASPRLAMAAALAGLFAHGTTIISKTHCLETMYPGFENELSRFQSEEAADAERVPVVVGLGGGRPQVVVKFDQPASGVVVAIDGPAASGKSTVSRDLARALGFVHVNSGAMYRAVTRAVLDAGIDPSDAGAVDACLRRLRIDCGLRDGDGTVEINGVVADGLSAADVNAAVSAVARIPSVRAVLYPLQRRYAELANIVMEGRDIGSAIFPETPYKYYVDASPEVRARRRAAQGLADSVTERDRVDSTREVAPLRLADGALVIDSSEMTVEKVVACIVDDLRAKGLVV